MPRFSGQIREDLRAEIVGLVLVAFSALCYVSLFGTSTGAVGAFLSRVLRTLFGQSSILAPALIGVSGLTYILERRGLASSPRTVGLGILIMLTAAFFHLDVPPGLEIENAKLGLGGGLVGGSINWVLVKAFGPSGRLILLVLLALVAVLLVTGGSLVRLAAFSRRVAGSFWRSLVETVRDFLYLARPATESDEAESILNEPRVVHPAGALEEKTSRPRSRMNQAESAARKEKVETDGSQSPRVVVLPRQTDKEYQLPPLTLLRKVPRPGTRSWEREAAQKSKVLEETLASFGVKAEVKAVSHGPAITRFEVQPAPGVKVSRIVNLADDIALSMAASDVRIVAPIPGKAAVGIEVPNREISPVYLRELLETREFQGLPSPLAVALGQDIAGRPVIFDLERALHLLIAGATGSGKSVCINALICSILFKAHPDRVKILMIDPKMVELIGYNGIPHLLAPVVTDPKRAAGVLRWVVREMENRYERFAKNGVRDITRYNQRVLETGMGEEMPFIVVVIDELADLMAIAPVDVEDAIQRLAQMARAAGIHLVVATQRPSVDVITGVIKANIPSRIAFAVSSQVDSRTILDVGGAEKLVGKGDMLFYPVGASKPVRVQGAYVSENETESLLEFVRAQAEPEYRDEVVAPDADPLDLDDEPGDELFAKALRAVVDSGQASVSMIQRRLRVGYTRAGRLIDMMEEKGYVGPHQGPKPREVLITLKEYEDLYGR